RELAEKARAAPHAAAGLFSSDSVARWYETNGWTYPIQGPVASGVAGLQQFFEAVGLSVPPRVDISEVLVNLRGQAGERLQHPLEVSPQEKRAVSAAAASNQSWLEVGPIQAEGRTATIPLVVPVVPGLPGDTHLARVHVRANGNQQFVVGVRLIVGDLAPPRPAAPARPIDEPVVRVSPVKPASSPPRSNRVPPRAVHPEPDLSANGAADMLAIPKEPPVSPPRRPNDAARGGDPAGIRPPVPSPPSPPKPAGRTPPTAVEPAPDRGPRLPGWLHVLPLLLLVLAGV